MWRHQVPWAFYRGRGELSDHVLASHRLVNPDNVPAVEIIAASPSRLCPTTRHHRADRPRRVKAVFHI
jgi:hypothetical protein